MVAAEAGQQRVSRLHKWGELGELEQVLRVEVLNVVQEDVHPLRLILFGGLQNDVVREERHGLRVQLAGEVVGAPVYPRRLDRALLPQLVRELLHVRSRQVVEDVHRIHAVLGQAHPVLKPHVLQIRLEDSLPQLPNTGLVRLVQPARNLILHHKLVEQLLHLSITLKT